MGRHELSPPTVLSPRVARFSKGVANSNVKAEANNHRPGATEPPLPLTWQRLELIKAYAKDPLRNADGLTASRIAQRFAPRAPAAPPTVDHRADARTPLTAPLSALNSGIRTLTAVLVIVALLPNLTLAAFWLGAIDMPWSKQATPPFTASSIAAQSAPPPPVLSTPSALEASAGEHVSFPIALDGTDAVPPSSVIVIRGLPQGSRLSNGYRHGETEWTLKPDEIGDLYLVLPAFAIGESKLTIQLVAPGDRIVADASTTLRLIADRETAEGGAPAIENEPAEPQDTQAQEPAAALGEETASIDAAPVGPESSDPVPLPTRRPAPPASDDGHADWIKPSAYVNLRKEPKPSAPVISVVAKGAKLRVIGRKQRWVQVTNPATSESGWIYASNVDTVR